LWIVVFHKLHVDAGHLLNALKNVETTPSTIPFQRICRVSDLLQFTQNEVGNDEHSIQETGFADIGNAAVDDDAGIEDLISLSRRPFATENAAHRRQIQHVSLVRSNDESDVGH